MTPATEAPVHTRTGPIPSTTTEPSIQVIGRMGPRYDEILTPEAIAFLTELHQRFGARRHDRLADRMRRRFEIGNGHDPRFRDDTAHIREDAEWQVAGAGPGLEDRRVEITGPTDPKMTINALNSGRAGVAGRPGGRHEPHLEERHRGPALAARRDPRRAVVHQPRERQGVPTRSPPSAPPRS